MTFGPLKVGSLVYGAGGVMLRVDAIYKPARGRAEVVTLTGVLSNVSLPPMTRDKVEAMERAR